jgi:replicative DNA helicase
MTDIIDSARNGHRHVEQTDRVPLHDVPAEMVVLGAVMAKRDTLDRVRDQLAAEQFYRPRHGEIYAAILDARDADVPTEPVALAGFLADRGEGGLNRLGGAAYLFECYQAEGAAGDVDHYVNRILEAAGRRAVEAAGIQLTQAASTPGRTVDDLADLARDLIEQAKPRRSELGMTQLGTLINPCLDDIEQRPHRPAGISTGFTDLDRLLGGLRRKQLITIAGATSMGKSVLALDIARHAAIKQGLVVAFFSLEMDKPEIFERVIAAEAGVPWHHVRDGTLDERDWQRIAGRIGPMSNAPLFLSDDAPMTVRQIRARCERLRRQHGLDLVVVDHLHLVDAGRRIDDDVKRLGEISRGLKSELAMPLDVPVLAPAQLNRNPNLRQDKIPQLSDLKGSSSIEQDSNVVILLHRPDYYDHESPRAGEADFIIAKNRNGPKDTITVAAQLYKSRFADMAVV